MIGLEDVELLNADSPENITGSLRQAVDDALRGWGMSQATEQRVRAQLRERCSFHLMAPMTEAYFFADPAAFARATTSPCHPCCFDASACDVEAFAVDDAEYLAAPDHPDIRWTKPNRRHHPKHYLEYLTDPARDGKFRYDETTLGAEALAGLDWRRVTARDPDRLAARCARSLFADLADMLGDLPTGWRHEDLESDDCHPITWPPPADALLRNL